MNSGASSRPGRRSRARRICGVDADAIRSRPGCTRPDRRRCRVHGLGLTEHVQGTDGVMALINLALLTGNLGKPGGGVNPLRGQNNVQGAAHMGCEPGTLPGSTPLDARTRRIRAALGRAAAAHARPQPARDDGRGRRRSTQGALGDRLRRLPDESERAARPRVPCSRSTSSSSRTCFSTKPRANSASVFLPACSSFEKDGTFMNAERRIQRVRAALRPVGDSKPDWQIVCRDRARDGRPRVSRSVRRGRSGTKCARSVPAARGMTYARLDAGGLQWPCPAEDHPGTPILHARAVRAAHRVRRCDASSHRATPERTSERLSVPADHGPITVPVQRRHDDRPHPEQRAAPLRCARHLTRRRNRQRNR